AAALKAEIGQVRDVAESADLGLKALRDELTRMREDMRSEIAGVREIAEAARAQGDKRVEAMQAELAFALASLDELKQGLSSAGPRRAKQGPRPPRPGRRDPPPRGRAGPQGGAERRRRLDGARHRGLPADPGHGRRPQRPAPAPAGAVEPGEEAGAGQARAAP